MRLLHLLRFQTSRTLESERPFNLVPIFRPVPDGVLLFPYRKRSETSSTPLLLKQSVLSAAANIDNLLFATKGGKNRGCAVVVALFAY